MPDKVTTIVQGKLSELDETLCVNEFISYYPLVVIIKHYRQLIRLVMYTVSTNGEQASLANLKMTIGSLLECS